MGNFYMESTQINYRRDETLKTVDQKLQELSETSAIDTDIAPVFKSTNTYQPGDMVYYRNKLYVFNVEHTGAWAAADVTATDVTSAMNAALVGKADYADLAGAFSAETAYTAGDLVIYNGIVYRCTNDHTGAWDADDFSATTIAAELNSINSNLSGKQNATDNNLTTTSKTVVGGINELKSGLTNVETAINGNMAIIKVNNPTTGENHLSYPSGYNRDNTIIITGIVKLSHESYFNPDDFDYIVTRPNGITCKITNVNVDYTYYVVVAKKDIPV